MNIKLYNATNSQLRGKAIECLAVIESLLQDGAPVDETTVSKIIEHALDLVQYEGAMHSLQQYFPPQPEVPPATPPRPPPTEAPLVITPEISPTYKKSLEEQKVKKAATARRKKKNE
jgi:hypothetical protein